MTVRGIGIDIVRVERITAAIEKNPRFLERILTASELGLNLSPERVAARWACKEAIYKATGKLNWHDVSVLNDSGGAPKLDWHVDPPAGLVQVSLSHEHDVAVAVAIWLAP